ncbi:CocE/NonD family hydrolase [Okibacterium endophyticum]
MSIDRPWKRPGALRYARERVRGILRPPVTVTPSPGEMVKDVDVAVRMRDGVVLRVNVYRPAGDGPFPVLMSAHPYGKDAALPQRTRRGWRASFQYRILRQPTPVTFSDETGWEAPDPAWWTARGYAVVNADLRGAGTSDGTGTLMSEQEGTDVYDLIEWAGAEPWSTGSVGMLGVSYLAMSQYRAAALHPPSLKAICPWEGFSDAYRDLFAPGGIPERGFSRIWQLMMKRKVRLTEDLATRRRQHPLRDEWWQSLVPDASEIDVPMLICTSFSDNNLHSRGSFRLFQRAGSAERFAWTHRAGKWSTFYSDEALSAQLGFFERYLRLQDTPVPARVRLEVRERGDRVFEVRDESEWPLARTEWTKLYLHTGGVLSGRPQTRTGTARFRTRRHGLRFDRVFDADTELTGPMSLDLWVSAEGADDVNLFVGVEKWRGREYVPFEGAYGYGRDRITSGWQRVSLRGLDPVLSTPQEPVHTFSRAEPIAGGEIVNVRVALGPSSTFFRAGESLRLVVAGRPLSSRNPLTGHFPAWYEPSRPSTCTLHWGPGEPAALLVPVIPGIGSGRRS